MRSILAAICLILLTIPAYAGGWEAVLSSYGQSPTRVLAIDKSSQTFFILERKSPLKLVSKLPCTTGQAKGDKLLRGDLRTPEGVYFLGHKIRRGLDWSLYGNHAYSLNYPNPIDRLKGKTGSGIWLHGRGKQLVPRDTRGCVALTAKDIRKVDDLLALGTPVVIASNFEWSRDQGADAIVARELAGLVNDWAAQWQDGAPAFFDHYAPKKFTRSSRVRFSHFKKRKEQIFRTTPWRQVMVGSVRAVPGPDYWVTWFDQYYRTPALTNAVGKRLYWQRDDKGDWRIVGREFTRPTTDIESAYLKRTEAEVKAVVDRWLADWKRADVDAYGAYYASNALQGDRRGIDNIVSHKKKLWDNAQPVTVAAGPVMVSLDSAGVKVGFRQEFKDSSGYSDVGWKTLLMRPAKSGWTIVSEQWRRLK